MEHPDDHMNLFMTWEAGVSLKWQSKGKLYLLLDAAYQGADGHEFAQNTVSCVQAGVGAGIHF